MFVRAYVGYRKTPDWLTTGVLPERAGGRKAYRRCVHEHVTRGVDPCGFEEKDGPVALGSAEFLSKVKRRVGRVTNEQPQRRQVTTRVTVADVVKVWNVSAGCVGPGAVIVTETGTENSYSTWRESEVDGRYDRSVK